MIVRPMQMQMMALNENMTEINSCMDSLAGSRQDIFKTNDLLSMLRQQDRLLNGARSSLEDLATVRNELADLKSQLVNDHSHIDQVQKTLQQFSNLKAEILMQKPAMEDMQIVWNELKTIQKELVESRTSLTSMMATWNQIQSLHGEINNHAQVVHSADSIVNSLLKIESKLMEKTPDMLARADDTLNQLLEFQVALDQQSQLVPQSLRSMETLGELELEINGSINRIRDMRRDLLDFALLEQSIKDTLRVLSPVLELTNAKRLSLDDVREVAKNLEERRHSSLTMQPSLVSHQGNNTFDFKPSTKFHWEESLLNQSSLLNTTNDTLTIETEKSHCPPAVDMPE
jgi:DNA repair exonuclease SbcCD ATPase subunit